MVIYDVVFDFAFIISATLFLYIGWKGAASNVEGNNAFADMPNWMHFTLALCMSLMMWSFTDGLQDAVGNAFTAIFSIFPFIFIILGFGVSIVYATIILINV